MKKRIGILALIILITIIAVVAIKFLNPKYSFESISISLGQYDEITNTKAQNLDIKLEKIKFNDYSLIIDDKNNTIYYSIINDSAKKFSPDVFYKANDKSLKLGFLKDEINNERIQNNYVYKLILYNDNFYRIYDLKCTNLPIVNINYEDNESKDKNQAEVFIFDNLSNSSKRVTISDGRFEDLDDKYILTLNYKSPGRNTRKNEISIFSMDKDNKYVLVPSSYDGKENGKEHNRDKKELNVELFINNEYQGLYTIKRK